MNVNETSGAVSAIDDNSVETEIAINNYRLRRENKIRIKIVQIIKRTVDIVIGGIGTIMLVPITIGIYIARIITCENDGPIFYKQLRIGKDGKHFELYKYRSMVIGADEKLKEYLENNEEIRNEYKKNHKLKDDPRITKVGKFLRKTSLDEFPQFLNVLKGDMSIVGPRPYLVREEHDMSVACYKAIISVKPGLTGEWQVSGRSKTDFKERIRMDVNYTKTRTLKKDFKILFRTVAIVFKKEGAM